MFSQMEHERQVKELAEKLNQKLKPSPEELREELRLQYEKDRAYEQRVKDEAKAADQLKKGIALQASIRQAQHYIADHQAKVVQWEASVDSMKEQLDDLFADGFRFPEPEAPKAVAEQPKPATPVFPDQSPADPFPGFQRVEHIFCPNDCGHKIPPGIAFHWLPETVICILDEKRARGAGISAEAIAEFRERQRIAKENQQ